MRSIPNSSILFPFALLAAPALATPLQTVSNLGLSGLTAQQQAESRGDRVLFLAREDGQDRNGDGDGNDTVAHVVDTSTGIVTTIGVAVLQQVGQPPMLGDRLCVLPAREASYGPSGTDLNGDGDANDIVAHVHDLETGVTTNLRLLWVVAEPPTAGDYLVLRVPEDGADKNGDGDTDDFVLHTWHVGQAAPVNQGIAVNYTAVGRRGALVTVSELAQNADLNGDGDIWDAAIVHAYDRATDTVTNLGIPAVHLAVGRDRTGDVFAFDAHEAVQGAGVDWNNDGDFDDFVLHAWIAPTATVRNLGYPVRTEFEQITFFGVEGARILFGANEARAGVGVDWNGDGDANDVVLHVHDARAGTTRNTGLAVRSIVPPTDGRELLLAIPEAEQGGLDRNGDGDALDQVAALYDVETGTVTNLAIATAQSSGNAFSRDLITFRADEAAQGGQDWNGDGRLTPVVAVRERANGSTSFLRTIPDHFGPYALGDSVSFLASESLSMRDHNGDGDLQDTVLHTWDATAGVANRGLAVEWGWPGVTPRGLVFRVHEVQQGADLNADADLLDRVVHLLLR